MSLVERLPGLAERDHIHPTPPSSHASWRTLAQDHSGSAGPDLEVREPPSCNGSTRGHPTRPATTSGPAQGAASVLLRRALERGGETLPDGPRLALCVEGGGMRGIVSGGMLVAFAEMDLLRHFDCVYGVSAGAVNAAYCYAGQISDGLSIYLDYINSPRFFTFHRLLSGDLLDLDYLEGRLLSATCRLNPQALQSSGVPLKAVVLDTRTSSETALPLTGTLEHLVQVIRAAVTVAGCVRPSVSCLEGRFADAAVVDPTGFRCAEHDGFTHAILLLSRPSWRPPRRHGLLEELVLRPRLRGWPKEVAHLISLRDAAYRESLARVQVMGGGTPSRVAIIEPAAGVGTFEMNRARLAAAFRLGYDAARAAVGAWAISAEP